jgi:hypothetical protein
MTGLGSAQAGRLGLEAPGLTLAQLAQTVEAVDALPDAGAKRAPAREACGAPAPCARRRGQRLS